MYSNQQVVIVRDYTLKCKNPKQDYHTRIEARP